MWTLQALTKHLFRQRSARILLVCFALTLLWIQSPVMLGSSVNRVFLGAGDIQAGWPRWVVYAWWILFTLSAGTRTRYPSRLPHPLEPLSPWFGLRASWEALLLCCCAELMIFGISSLGGAWFHVEPSQVITNLLLSLSATCLWIFSIRHQKNRVGVLAVWGLVVAFLEFTLLDFLPGWGQSRFALAVLLMSLGLTITVNPYWKNRCKSLS